jgi:hypothetical protein
MFTQSAYVSFVFQFFGHFFQKPFSQMLVTFQAFSALFDYLHSLFFSVLCSKMLKNFDKKALSKRSEIEAIFFLFCSLVALGNDS